MKLAFLTIGGQWVGASNWLLQQSGENPFTDYRVDGAMNDQIKSELICLFNSPTLFNLVRTECGASREIKEAIWSLIVIKKIDHQTAQEQFRTNGTFAILSNIYFPIVEFGLFFGLSACIFACVFKSNGRALVMDGRRVAK